MDAATAAAEEDDMVGRRVNVEVGASAWNECYSLGQPSTSSAAHTPGVMLGPDGKPCTVCDGFKSGQRETRPIRRQASSSSSSNTTEIAKAVVATDSATTPLWGEYEPETPCPPDSIELGNHSWTFLHTSAAYYPDSPTPQHQSAMAQLLQGVSQLYPCGWCATHMREYMQAHPPQLESRTAVSQWMCVMHNDVNRRLGKPEFDCSRVMERWKESLDLARCGPEGRKKIR
ncbi:ERV/ALR sulfhydryl oxidase domain-containing protein [Catenaria anguillulae PL171]|uniref:Sulfhydryl oxidase n=1 Tax=Catenaria anguillulae PL171 TaxID=765915 RepID=A0A1Y2HLE2_9FUNG|nr:ERV/ALR sulfhydryl oxidase domain-containing protein [Catenaria anguillulae PL171]